jgi:hypothetical protein
MNEKSDNKKSTEKTERNYLVYFTSKGEAKTLAFCSNVPINNCNSDIFFVETDEQFLFNEAYAVIRSEIKGIIRIQKILIS